MCDVKVQTGVWV